MLSEVNHYLRSLDDQRGHATRLIRDLPVEALNWRPELPKDADPVNSLAALAAHIASAEHFWISENIGRSPYSGSRPGELFYVAESAKDLTERLESVGEETHNVLKELNAEQLDSSMNMRVGTFDDEMSVPVRWAILNVINHSALHVGQMQLIYQLWNKGKAASAMMYFDGLPRI